MRENRPYGSEGGVATSHPYPYREGECLFRQRHKINRMSRLCFFCCDSLVCMP